MATVRVTPLGGGRTEVVHEASGTSLTTASSPEWGGVGGSFSATDLVAAALGSCIGSSIAGPLERRGVELDAVTIEVTKSLAEEPRRIGRLAVVIHLPAGTDAGLAPVIERAALTCAVGRSLDVTETVEVVVGD
jgi:uncharacterized OsmC-like protein